LLLAVVVVIIINDLFVGAEIILLLLRMVHLVVATLINDLDTLHVREAIVVPVYNQLGYIQGLELVVVALHYKHVDAAVFGLGEQEVVVPVDCGLSYLLASLIKLNLVIVPVQDQTVGHAVLKLKRRVVVVYDDVRRPLRSRLGPWLYPRPLAAAWGVVGSLH
jgi:hypothetical protein